MKKHILTGAIALFACVAQAAPVVVNVDSSLEGIASFDSNQSPLSSGFYEIGWLAPGTTQSTISNLFAAGDLAGIDSIFNTVVSFAFPNGSLTDPNTFGFGHVYQSNELVADGGSLTAYKDSGTGAAGKQMFGWVRNSAALGETTEMAFVQFGTFPTANDTFNFSDYSSDFSTDGGSISQSNVWVGALAPVQLGGGMDTNSGSPANGLGLYDGPNVLETAQVIPEPSSAMLVLVGLGLLARRRRA